MSSRWQRYLTEAGRFLAVGGLATLVSLILFNVLVHGLGSSNDALLPDEPIPAFVIANIVGMAVSFHGSRTWAFRDRPTRHADGGVSAFVAINLITMLLPIGCLTFTRSVLGLSDPLSDNIAANVVGLALGTAARFYLFRTLVFKRPINLNDIYGPDEVSQPPVSTDRSTNGRARPPAA